MARKNFSQFVVSALFLIRLYLTQSYALYETSFRLERLRNKVIQGVETVGKRLDFILRLAGAIKATWVGEGHCGHTVENG